MAGDEPLQPHTCNVLLHLCSGGTTGGSYDGGGGADAAAQAAKVVVPPRDAVHPVGLYKVDFSVTHSVVALQVKP